MPDRPAERPVEIVVAFTPGGASDRLARAIAPAMSAHLGSAVTVVNLPGGAGNPAARHVARAPADGHTLLLGNNGLLAANPLLFPDIGYDPIEDFLPVSLIGTQPSVLVVSPRLSAHSVGELVKVARSAPPRLSMAVSGYGSAAHLAGALFRAMAGLELDERGYDGAAPALEDLAHGTADLMFATASSVLPHIADGRVRPLAVTSATRAGRLPQVATMAELGFSGFDVTSWHGLAAPAGTPASAIGALREGVAGAIGEADVRATLDALAIDVVASTPQEFAAHIAAEVPKWAALVEMSGTAARRRA